MVPRKPGLARRLFYAFMLAFVQAMHMTCRQFIRRASDKYERSLGPWERLLQAMHRGMCEICRIHEQRMDRLRDLAHEIGHATPEEPVDAARLGPEASARIRAAMEKAAKRGK
jgi:hypothetical protein